MCGILLSVGLSHHAAFNKYSEVVERLRPRGPDGLRSKTIQFSRSSNGTGPRIDSIPLTFVASVLALRGDALVAQPLEDSETGSLLCWNGEAWLINGEPVQGNDTVQVHRGLLAAAQLNKDSRPSLQSENLAFATCDHVMQYLASISGPFAFVFYDMTNAKVYFGRDFLGRRSLLLKDGQDDFCLSSVSGDDKSWIEVESSAIYVLHLDSHLHARDLAKQSANDSSFLTAYGLRVTSLPWAAYGRSNTFNRKLGDRASSGRLRRGSTSISTLGRLLNNSIALRINKDRMVELPSPAATDAEHVQNENQQRTFYTNSTSSVPATYAVMFSGGLDCSVLARLLHDQLPSHTPIDLLNVVFENPRLRDQARQSPQSLYDLCPDRITARKSYQELSRVCPGRIWRLVEMDVSFAEYRQHRETIVSLMYPHATEMDLSIAMALYFAARAQGNALHTPNGSTYSYTSPARVLFSGLGADELFGGYQRHATAFSRDGYEALLDALELDITRLGNRNLGRDDRVISHWGKEARYPYLDEEFVKWAVEQPVWNKCGFGQEASSSDEDDARRLDPGKRILRLLANKLDLYGIAREKKRAIQFGARTAKMEGRSKGTETISSPWKLQD